MAGDCRFPAIRKSDADFKAAVSICFGRRTKAEAPVVKLVLGPDGDPEVEPARVRNAVRQRNHKTRLPNQNSPKEDRDS
jgi:hypothetical protein